MSCGSVFMISSEWLSETCWSMYSWLTAFKSQWVQLCKCFCTKCWPNSSPPSVLKEQRWQTKDFLLMTSFVGLVFITRRPFPAAGQLSNKCSLIRPSSVEWKSSHFGQVRASKTGLSEWFWHMCSSTICLFRSSKSQKRHFFRRISECSWSQCWSWDSLLGKVFSQPLALQTLPEFLPKTDLKKGLYFWTIRHASYLPVVESMTLSASSPKSVNDAFCPKTLFFHRIFSCGLVKRSGVSQAWKKNNPQVSMTSKKFLCYYTS